MLRPGSVGAFEVVVEDRHTAHAMGNVGVRVVSTPTLAHFCALAARNAVLPGLGEGEVAVPLRATVSHLKASPPGARIAATARVTAIEGRRVSLAVEARPIAVRATPPGWRVLTRIPCSLTSAARDWENPSTANFEAL